MRKATTKEIILDWLGERVLYNQKIVKSHQFETDLVTYGKMYWGATKLPSAYSRAWRQIRAEKGYIDIGIDQVKDIKTKSNEGVWELIINT